MKLSVLLAPLMLGACVAGDGLRVYSGPDDVIATGVDKGRDTGALTHGRAAIAYDPDGCQNWIIDDGVEGYSSPRFDPASGLPVCNDKFPPGTVIRDYQSGTQGLKDFVPGPGRKVVVVKQCPAGTTSVNGICTK
ncbi:hypothetical protein Q9295_06755 [Xinfangfangia sp. CPCC 101601]|uniref:Lipoprotein n=1 Tax=Pseudogemmobacter lacusdianii TaxID=3069608 RepID=A0ABU0VWD6_9RHOB|nr:hypothetical protein [Xinfangfangia sp. CPCC 101601]MDQ2066064.1 hypothetical protein [Xinfangfangia sp. CPCC 101601]